MKYAINSKGETVQINDNDAVLRFIPQEVREKEMRKFVNDFSVLMQHLGVDSDHKGYCFMVQPLSTKEQVLFFTKTEFSSSSQAVKLANELNKHPEALGNKEKREFLQSIFRDESSASPRYYFLNVGSITFERNQYDCKRINVGYRQPIPYAEFKASLDNWLITQDEMDAGENCEKYKLSPNGIDLENSQFLLSIAFDRDIVNGQESKFDKNVFNAIAYYKKAKGYGEKDAQSNLATTCLSVINEPSRNIYEIYEEVKNCIKKTYQGAYNVRYKGSRISATLENGNKIALYVGGTKENPQFIVGGKVLYSIEELKTLLTTPEIYEEKAWFTSKVKPNITNPSPLPPKKESRADVIHWNKQLKAKTKTSKPTDRFERHRKAVKEKYGIDFNT